MGFIYFRDCENLLLCNCFERTGAGLGRWPQILDSTLGGSEFQTEVKKNSLICLHSKAHGK